MYDEMLPRLRNNLRHTEAGFADVLPSFTLSLYQVYAYLRLIQCSRCLEARRLNVSCLLNQMVQITDCRGAPRLRP